MEHYRHTVKLYREICAKVVTGFTGSHDATEALSELELALLHCSDRPEDAVDTALKYLQDIAKKTELSESSDISHINFIDAENMLYITGRITCYCCCCCCFAILDPFLNVFMIGQRVK